MCYDVAKRLRDNDKKVTKIFNTIYPVLDRDKNADP